jgi:hypothetical protein
MLHASKKNQWPVMAFEDVADKEESVFYTT